MRYDTKVPLSNFIRFESVYFQKNEIVILNNVNFTIQSGESTVLLGRNGAGKTTIVNLIFGYLWSTSGEITVLGDLYGGRPIRPIQDQIGILQSSHQEQLLQKSLTALEIVITGIHTTLGLYHDISDKQREIALTGLSSLNMESKANQRFSTLSSGEKTKVLLLRAIGSGKQILILDEPTVALDLTARYQFEKSIATIKKENPRLTRILITHKIEEIPEDFTNVLLLKEGEIIAFGKKSDILTNEHLSNLYDLQIHVNETGGRYFTSIQN